MEEVREERVSVCCREGKHKIREKKDGEDRG